LDRLKGVVWHQPEPVDLMRLRVDDEQLGDVVHGVDVELSQVWSSGETISITSAAVGMNTWRFLPNGGFTSS
jgi:hypothetical protein